MFKPIVKFFDKLEDIVRAKLSHKSIIYAFIGGTLVVLYWRGIWHTADILMAKGGIWGYIFYEPHTIVWTTVLLLLTGLFVAVMIGDRIILSGIKHEKKIEEKTVREVQEEETEIEGLESKINKLNKDVQKIKEILEKNSK